MIDEPNGVPICSRDKETVLVRASPSVLTMETPDLEVIARAIWQRQHDALDLAVISYSAKRRDQSIPFRFWNEFLLDAQVVLLLLCRKRTEYQNTPNNLLPLSPTPIELNILSASMDLVHNFCSAP